MFTQVYLDGVSWAVGVVVHYWHILLSAVLLLYAGTFSLGCLCVTILLVRREFE